MLVQLLGVNWSELNSKPARAKIFRIHYPPNFQIQVANGQVEKPTAKAAFEFDIAVHIFAEYSVVMKNLTGPIMGLQFMRLISLVIDNTHGHHHYPHLAIQVQRAARKMSANFQAVILHDSITVPLMTTTTITAFVDH